MYLMVFQLGFTGPCHNIRMCLGNTLVVCELYGLFLHSGYFLVYKVEAFRVKKSPFCVVLMEF